MDLRTMLPLFDFIQCGAEAGELASLLSSLAALAVRGKTAAVRTGSLQAIGQ